MAVATLARQERDSVRPVTVGMTGWGCLQTLRLSGHAVILGDPSVALLNGRGGESWPAGISTSTVASGPEEVEGLVKAEPSTGGMEPRQ